MTENTEDDRLISNIENIFKQHNPKNEDIHFTSVKEVDGFYVASSFNTKPVQDVHPNATSNLEGECIQALYFILPKDNKESKGAIINITSHPEYDSYGKTYDHPVAPKTSINLSIEGKQLASISKEGYYVNVHNISEVGYFLHIAQHGQWNYGADNVRDFLTKFVTSEQELDLKRHLLRQKKKEQTKKAFQNKINSIKNRIHRKINAIPEYCKKTVETIKKERQQKLESRKEAENNFRLLNSYTKKGNNKRQ